MFLLKVGLQSESEAESTYRKVLTMLPGGSIVLEDGYSAIQKTVDEFTKYVNVRLAF